MGSALRQSLPPGAGEGEDGGDRRCAPQPCGARGYARLDAGAQSANWRSARVLCAPSAWTKMNLGRDREMSQAGANYAAEMCAYCGGRGNSDSHPCRACGGQGSVLVAQPARTCVQCQGRGRKSAYRCSFCLGTGWAQALRPGEREGQGLAHATEVVQVSLGDVWIDANPCSILSSICEGSSGGIVRSVRATCTERLRGRLTTRRRVTA